MPKPPFDHFGLFAPFYEHLIRPPEISHLAELLAPQPGQLLLDVGGGTGRITQQLQRYGARLVIVDPSWGMLQQARDKRCCTVYRSTAEQLPFATGTFPRMVAVDSFHHFWNHAQAAAELVRVLAPGGRLVLEEFDLRHLAIKAVALAERLALMRSRFFTPTALASLFQAQGAHVRLDTPPRAPVFWAIVEKPG